MRKRLIIFTLSLLIVNPNHISAEKCDIDLPIEYTEYLETVSEEYGICPEFIEAVIEAESNGNCSAKSKRGCLGLMQINPRYNKGRMKRLNVTDLYDPYQNILCGIDLLSELFEKYEDPYVVLMAYNEGEYSGAVERAQSGKFSNYAKKIINRSESLERMHGK